MEKLPTHASPLVSAIVSSYSSSKFIGGCLESLATQTIAPLLEVIVVVSGSPESEWEITRRFESRFANLVMLKTGRREGLYTAWNRAIRISRGKFITNANTDDRLSPKALERLAAVLAADEKLGLVYADCIQTEIENETFPTTSAARMLDTQDYCFYDLLRYCYIGPCPMWRRDVHAMIGGFDDSYRSAADYDFWLRLGEKYPMAHLRETLGLYLDQPGSLAHQQIGKDESVAILHRRRESVPLDSVFPELFRNSHNNPEVVACSAMADLCLEGPWPADLELALSFLERAAKFGGSRQNDINRAVLLAALGNQSEARRLLQKYSSDPTALHNLVWINSLTSNQGSQSPIMIRTRHPLIDIAKQKQGLDPNEVKLKLLSLSNSGIPTGLPAIERDEPVSESVVKVQVKKSPDSILLMQHSHPLDPDGPNGGAETALIHLARALAAQGGQVTVAAPLRGARGVRDGVTYDDIGTEYDYKAALQKHAPQHDVLIVSNRGDVAREAARYTNLRKRLLWLHVNIPDATGLKPQELNHCADKIICVSKFHKTRFEQTGVNPEVLKVIYNGTDPRTFYAHSVHRDHYRICFTGALVPLKGVHVLLDAFLRVKESIPQAVLDIYGSADMWGESEYIDQSCWRGMGINFHGKVSQHRLAEAYSRSTMLVIPSRIELGETFGLGSIDAQACACPVLTTPCGGVVETVIDGVTGKILKQDSAGALAGGMIEMMMDPFALPHHGGEAGRTHVLQNFLWEQTAAQFQSIINDVEAVEARTSLPHLQAPVRLGGPAMAIPGVAEVAIRILTAKGHGMIRCGNQEREQAQAQSTAPRVAWLTTFNQPCGLATYAGYLTDALAAYGIKPWIVAERTTESNSTDDKQVIRCWTREVSGGSAVVKELVRRQVEIIHVNHGGIFEVDGWLVPVLSELKARGMKVVITFHSTEAPCPEYKTLCDLADQSAVHFPQNILQLTALGANPVSIQVIPHGLPSLEEQDIRLSKQAVNWNPEEIWISTFGFIEPHKGLDEVIKSLRDIRLSKPVNLFVAGSAHPHNPASKKFITACRDLAKAMGVENRVIFANRFLSNDEVKKYLMASDAIVMNYKSNRFEASGAAAVALSSGRPVITSTAPSFDYPIPLTVKISEKRTLAECVKEIIEQPNLRRLLLDNLKQYELEANWTRIARLYTEIYRQLAGRRVGGTQSSQRDAMHGSVEFV